MYTKNYLLLNNQKIVYQFEVK